MCKHTIVEEDFVLIDQIDPAPPPPPPPSSAVIIPTPSSSPDYLDLISTTINSLSPALRKLSLSIHSNPELSYHEHHAHSILTSFFRTRGWKVIPHAYGIDTAFIAVFESGKEGPSVGFNVEYDALEGIGHACGHNLIAVAGCAGALAAGAVMERLGLGGRVVVFGTPAEEGGGGKIKLLEAGAYTDNEIAINLISHPGIVPDNALMTTAAYTSFSATYHGKEAHAAAAPWEGINALDALITAYNAISVLRQQTQPGDIIQGNITHGGVRPNIIHAYAAGNFVVRSTTKTRRDALLKRVEKCFVAGAEATGAKLEIKYTGSYDDHVPNRALGAQYRDQFNRLGGSIEMPELDALHAVTAASTDQGNVSYAMPSLSPGFWIRSEGERGEQRGGPHTPDFAKAAGTKEAHEKAMMVGKALAATAVDVLTVPGLLENVQKEFEEMKKRTKVE